MPIPGSNIRFLRERANMSLRDLEKASGVAFATLSRLENGVGGYSQSSIEAIATALRVSQEVLFYEPGVIESAELQKRRIPLLSAEQIFGWRGPDDFSPADPQVYLHAEVEVLSRYSFAFRVEDAANEPEYRRGDYLFFDAKRQPMRGELVIGLSEPHLLIGQFKPFLLKAEERPSAYEIVPYSRTFPTVSSVDDSKLVLRGTLAHMRRDYLAPAV